MIKKDTLMARRRQLCQDMGRMAWPDEALAAHPGATALTVAVTGGIPICSWRAWMSATEAI